MWEAQRLSLRAEEPQWTTIHHLCVPATVLRDNILRLEVSGEARNRTSTAEKAAFMTSTKIRGRNGCGADQTKGADKAVHGNPHMR